MIFYNGFNLLVDMLLAGLVFYFTRRVSWWDGYHEGYSERDQEINDYAEYGMDSYLEAQAEAYYEREH
jgi:hypothetical protein